VKLIEPIQDVKIYSSGEPKRKVRATCDANEVTRFAYTNLNRSGNVIMNIKSCVVFNNKAEIFLFAEGAVPFEELETLCGELDLRLVANANAQKSESGPASQSFIRKTEGRLFAFAMVRKHIMLERTNFHGRFGASLKIRGGPSIAVVYFHARSPGDHVWTLSKWAQSETEVIVGDFNPSAFERQVQFLARTHEDQIPNGTTLIRRGRGHATDKLLISSASSRHLKSKQICSSGFSDHRMILFAFGSASAYNSRNAPSTFTQNSYEKISSMDIAADDICCTLTALGHKPHARKDMKSKKILRLEKAISEAIRVENYEKALEIRSELRVVTSKLSIKRELQMKRVRHAYVAPLNVRNEAGQLVSGEAAIREWRNFWGPFLDDCTRPESLASLFPEDMKVNISAQDVRDAIKRINVSATTKDFNPKVLRKLSPATIMSTRKNLPEMCS